MDCERATNLMSARIDGELPEGEAASIELDAHLAECAGCRATAGALEAQDAGLVRAFAGGRRTADALAEAVVDRLGLHAGALGERVKTNAGSVAARAIRHARRWQLGLAAVAAGIVVAIVLLRHSPVAERLWAVRDPKHTPTGVPGGPRVAPREVAHVTLATGAVFTCPGDQTEWRPAPVGSAVESNTRIRTPASARCELRMTDGTRLCLNGDTEARLAGGRRVELERGQLWSAVPPGSTDMCVTVPPATGENSGRAAAFTPPGGQSDLACTRGGGAVLTVVRGDGRVTDGRGTQTLVRPGEALRLGNGTAAAAACTSVPDPIAVTSWIDELLLLRAPDDPELLARVGELLARIRSESATRPADATPAAPGAQEQEIRARGEAWSAPMACYVLSPTSQAERDRRIAAARLLADLAPPWTIPNLITMLGDREGAIREHAARALQRLTGQQLGDAPYLCPTESPQAASQRQRQWQAWWEANQSRYPKPLARR